MLLLVLLRIIVIYRYQLPIGPLHGASISQVPVAATIKASGKNRKLGLLSVEVMVSKILLRLEVIALLESNKDFIAPLLYASVGRPTAETPRFPVHYNMPHRRILPPR